MKEIASKTKILIACEWEFFGEIFTKMLKILELDIKVVDPHFKYENILTELENKRYDLIILTTNNLSPNQIPFLVSEIKRRYSNMPIIVCSGSDNKNLIDDLRSCGIDDYLPMPFEKWDLIESVRKVLLNIKTEK